MTYSFPVLIWGVLEAQFFQQLFKMGKKREHAIRYVLTFMNLETTEKTSEPLNKLTSPIRTLAKTFKTTGTVTNKAE